MAEQPNVVFVFTDQQTLRGMSAAGNPHLHTPAMDSLAASGVRFENSYCTSPVCSPARASLVTGRMPHEVGVDINDLPLRPAVPTMGDVFRRAGYETVWIGKWHVPEPYPSSADAVPGFRYVPLLQEVSGRLGRDADPPVAEAAVKFLRRAHDRPFLLAISLHNPHDICRWISEGITGQPQEEALPPLPDNFEPDPDEPQFITLCRKRDHYGNEQQRTTGWNRRRWRVYLHAYWRFCEEADHQLGRILEALREQGLEEDTLVLFTSDHGEGVAAHRWVVKLMLWEEVVRVPLIVSWTGRTPAGAVDANHLVSGLDVLPTICDYAGVEPPQEVRGMSLRPLIDRPDAPGRQHVVAELQPDPARMEMKGRMVRSVRHKYVAFSQGQKREMLFDLEADPGEMRNLAAEPDQRTELQSHRAFLREWMARLGDEFVLPQ